MWTDLFGSSGPRISHVGTDGFSKGEGFGEPRVRIMGQGSWGARGALEARGGTADFAGWTQMISMLRRGR
jgi:hypothetical protein